MTVLIKANSFKKAMFLKGYNLSDLSSATDVSISYLSQIMNGKKSPSPKLAKKIAETLEVGIKDLFIFEESVVK